MTEGTIATFLAAFSLSLAYSFVPGPVTVEALRRGTARGTRAVVSVRLGSLAGSMVWAAAALTGAGIAAQHPHVRLLLGVAGTATLLLLAWRALRPASQSGSAGCGTGRGDALAGGLITLASPMEAAFWLGLSGVMLSGATPAERITDAGAFLTGFIVADLLFTAVFGVVVGWGRCVLCGRIERAANLLCVATLAWFALHPLVRGMWSIVA